MPPQLRHTGFPSPADDYISKNLNLNELLIRHPSATYFIKFRGTPRFNVLTNDLLVVDKSLHPKQNQLVITVTDNEFHLEKFSHKTPEIWGTITNIIRHV